MNRGNVFLIVDPDVSKFFSSKFSSILQHLAEEWVVRIAFQLVVKTSLSTNVMKEWEA